MANRAVHIIYASSLIHLRQVVAATNDTRFLDALLPPGRLVITSTVWGEAAGNESYLGDRLLDQWLTAQKNAGRLVRIETPEFKAGTDQAGDNSIRHIVPTFSGDNVFVITDDGDLEKIIADFKKDEAAYLQFQAFARFCREQPTAVPPPSLFEEAIRASINRFISVESEGAVFPPDPGELLSEDVLEELLRREGLDVDWGPK